MVTLINPPSRLHYLRALRSPALLGCDCSKYGAAARAPLSGMRGPYYRGGRLAFLGQDEDQVVPGTFLIYTVNLDPTAFRVTSANGIVTKIRPVLLSKWGINIENSSTSDISWLLQGNNITLTLRSTRTYHLADDVRSIVDGEIYNTAGFRVQSSQIQKIDLPAGQTAANITVAPTPPDDGGAQNVTDWLSSNWIWLAAAGIGFVVVKEIL